ncbi:MAG: hypothetical protein ABIJ46_02890, partial [bacterium]
SSFMSFKKTYVCTEAVAASLPRCSQVIPRGSQYPCVDDEGCCNFKPRVQVLDNWGVCNGSCPNTFVGPDPDEYRGRLDGNLCFNSATTNYLAETLTGPTDSDNDNECKILSADDRRYVIPAIADSYLAPYTAYQGVIKVCPGVCP